MRLFTALPVLFAMLLGPPSEDVREIAVIVHVERAGQVDAEEMAQIFLKKRRFWADGSAILPVNRSAGASIRARFDAEVFGATARQLGVYWNREYFRGVLPPATLASDEAVRRFVADEPRAIGYVGVDAVDDSVRVVMTISVAEPFLQDHEPDYRRDFRQDSR